MNKKLYRIIEIHPEDAYFPTTLAGRSMLKQTGYWKKQFTEGSPCPEGYISGRFRISGDTTDVIFWSIKTEEIDSE